MLRARRLFARQCVEPSCETVLSRKRLAAERAEFERLVTAIQRVLQHA